MATSRGAKISPQGLAFDNPNVCGGENCRILKLGFNIDEGDIDRDNVDVLA